MHHNQLHLLKKRSRAVDELAYASGIASVLSAVPQVYDILVRHQYGVSLLSWTLWTLLALPWIAYGLIHKARAVLMTNVLWFVMDLLVVAGILFQPNGAQISF